MITLRSILGYLRQSYLLLMSIPYTLLGLLSFLYLIQSSGLVFALVEHRLTYADTYTLGFDVIPVLAVFAAICFIILCKSNVTYGILSLIGLILYPGFGLGVALAVSSLLLVSLGVYKLRLWKEFLTILLVAFSIVCFSSLVYWLIIYPLGWSYPLIGLATQEFYLYYITAPLSILCIATILVVSFYKPIVVFQNKDIQRTTTMIKPIDRRVAIYLSLIVGIGILAAIYPNLPGVNPNSINIGTDVMHYVPFLDQVNKDINQITEVYSGSRPLFFLMLLGFQRLFGLDSYWAVSLFPLVIIPLLALSIFYLVREITGDPECALWASFFTVAGIQTLAGLYGFLLADMFGLAFAFLTLTMFFKWSDSRSWRYLLGAMVFGVALLYTHPWTFDQYIPILALATIPVILLTKDTGSRVLLVTLIIIIAIGFGAAELVQRDIFGGVGILASLKTLYSVTTFRTFLDSITKSIFYFSGAFADIFFLGLVTVGLLKHEFRGAARLYFTLFPLITSIVFLIVDVNTKSRILFNIPFGLFAAVGMMEYRKINDIKIRRMFPIFIVLLLLAIQFRFLANLV